MKRYQILTLPMIGMLAMPNGLKAACRKTYILGALLAVALLPASTQGQIYKFEVPLDGGQEFPGPGDPDGTGHATLFIDAATLSITWDISVANIGLPITADHIHFGDAGVSGPVRIDFTAMLQGGPLVDPDLAGVLADPTGWYVNVHNSTFPAGAIRGQLSNPVLVPEGPLGIGHAAAVWFCLMCGAWHRRRKAIAH